MRWESMLASPCTNVRFPNALHSTARPMTCGDGLHSKRLCLIRKAGQSIIELPLGGSINLRILLSLFPAFERHQYS